MEIIDRREKPYHECVEASTLFEISNHWDATPFAKIDRGFAKLCTNRSICGLERPSERSRLIIWRIRAIGWYNEIGLCNTPFTHSESDPFRATLFNRSDDLCLDFDRILISNETASDLGKSLTRDDGLRSLTLVATADTIKL